MTKSRTALAILVCSIMIGAWGPPAAADPLRLGVLPVLDTLPLQVAVNDGLFAAEGIEVELVSFASALERDAAMQSGRLDGYFGDILATLLLIRNGVPMRIVNTCYHTRPGARMFALVASPSSNAKSLEEVSSPRVGVSKATIIEYLLDRMVAQAGLDQIPIELVEVKKIPLRFQMLMTDQLPLALLPEPLVSLAEHGGARVLLTDENLDRPVTVLCLHERVLDPDGRTAGRILAAYGKAVQNLRSRPEDYRALMAATCRVPEPIAKVLPIPDYPDPQLPGPEATEEVQRWMVERGMIDQVLPYDRLTPPAAAAAGGS